MTNETTESRRLPPPPHAFPDGSPDDVALTVTRRIMLVARRHRKVLDQSLREIGHSLAKWEILYAIAMDENETTSTQIAARVGLEGPGIVSTMEQLDRSGLIVRRKDPVDRRSRLVSITEQGRIELARMKDVSDGIREKILANSDLKDLVAARKLLTVMRKNIWDNFRV